MKKYAGLLAAIIMVIAMTLISFAAEGRKVYWGIDGETLILSAAETGCETQGAILADISFDTSVGRPWAAYNESITAIKVDDSAGKVKIRDCMDLFYSLNKVVTADLSGLDTSSTINMWCMFDGCSSLKGIDVSGFNTSNVTNMQGMFYRCSSLESLNLSNFDTQKVTNMFSMFADCSALRSIDLSSFNMANVKNATDMFAGCDRWAEIYTGEGWTAEGAPLVASWKKVGENIWYCLDMHGNKLTGWQKLWWNGKEDWYYFSKEGATFGICQLGGVTPDGYTLSENGALIDEKKAETETDDSDYINIKERVISRTRV